MSILITPDSFKGTHTADQVAAHIAQGVRRTGQKAVEQPVADGGEGTYEILRQAMNADPVSVDTVDPWRNPIRATYAMTCDGTAMIELAAASGWISPNRSECNPLIADTYGTGRLMAHAAEHGAQRIVLAAGGSATTDGGAGAIAAVEEHGGLRGAQVVVLSDVTTPFEDAAVMFGPQKGADSDQVRALTAHLHTQAVKYPRDPRGVPRTGAAGGFSGGIWACYDAYLVSGADFVLDAIDFDEKMSDATAIVVGEGRLDSQTRDGKVISAILARSMGVPVYAVVGSVDPDIGNYADKFAGILVASNPIDIVKAGEQIANLHGSRLIF